MSSIVTPHFLHRIQKDTKVLFHLKPQITTYCYLAVQGSSKIKTFHPLGKFPKTEGKQHKIASGSPWNWVDSVCLYLPCTLTIVLRVTQTSQAARKTFEIRPASLEQAETSQATRKRFRPWAAGEDALQLVVLPAGCAKCFSFQLCELSSMLGWALMIHLSLSYFCLCK